MVISNDSSEDLRAAIEQRDLHDLEEIAAFMLAELRERELKRAALSDLPPASRTEIGAG